MHPPEKLLVDRSEIELLFVNHIGDHSMFLDESILSLNLTESPVIGVLILVLKFYYNLFLRFS